MAMELDIIKTDTTWNDAAGSLNKNFSKVKLAIDQGVGSNVVVDTEMSDTSENAVQNKVIKAYADKHPQYEVIEEVEAPESGGTSGEGGNVDLTGYATEEWVKSQGYVTSSTTDAFNERLTKAETDIEENRGSITELADNVDGLGQQVTTMSSSIKEIEDKISGLGATIIDTEIKADSENAVQNKAIKAYVDKAVQATDDAALRYAEDAVNAVTGDEVYVKVKDKKVSLIVDTQGGGLGVREGSQGLGIIDIPEDAMGNVTKYVGEREAYLEGYAGGLVNDLEKDIKNNPSSYVPLKTVNGNSLYGSGNIVIAGSGSESELREIYVADALDESQKAYNAETYNKIREGAGVLPYIKGANGAPRYLCNFTLWGGSTPYITMKTYVFDTLQDGEYTYLLVKLMSDGTASSQDNEKTLPSLAVDSTLSSTSENPVQNKVVKTKFNEVDSWLTKLQNKVNDWVESLEELLGYFTEGKANDADKLDGHDSSHFATSEAVTQLSQKVDAIPTITVDTEMSDTSENAVQSKVIKAYVDDMKVREVSQSAITQIKLVPNTLFKLSDITSLVVTLAQGEIGVANYYMFEIAVGDAIPEITLPSSVRWMDGYDVLANLNKDTTYQISILNNLAVGGAFV